MNNIKILTNVQEILKKEFEEVTIKFLEDSLFDNAILNEISIEPAGETYKSIALGGFAEKETEDVAFTINLIRKQEFEGDTLSLENFIKEKDRIIELLYCEELLGITGDFRSFEIQTEPLRFTDDEVVWDIWLYKINVLGKVR
ncbi:MAG: hypothetical protein CR959_01820 [Fusobacteriales bacterium]|nr:MAG: hypothetical protein CR959_01820 [Fusobacteriales bacterium]